MFRYHYNFDSEAIEYAIDMLDDYCDYNNIRNMEEYDSSDFFDWMYKEVLKDDENMTIREKRLRHDAWNFTLYFEEFETLQDVFNAMSENLREVEKMEEAEKWEDEEYRRDQLTPDPWDEKIDKMIAMGLD